MRHQSTHEKRIILFITSVALMCTLPLCIQLSAFATRSATGVSTSTLQFNSATYVAGEGDGKVNILVTRSGSTTGAASVRYATSDGTAKEGRDYTAAFGLLNFDAGETSNSFTVLLIDNSYAAGARSVSLTLSNPTGADLSTPSTAVLTINDNDTVNGPNPLDQTRFFVQEHYYDFLGRYPDASGWDFWTNNINNCTAQPSCTEAQRVNTSAAYFLSIEFQTTGYLVERIYKAAYGSAAGTSTFGGTHQLAVPVVRFNEFLPDTLQIGHGVIVGQTGWEQVLENNKQGFSLDFVQRSRFTTAFPTSLTPPQFADELFANAGVTPLAADRNAAIAEFGSATNTSDTGSRARSLRDVAENSVLQQEEFNRAFVLMQYFGYLRRNPNDVPDSDYTGFDFWLTKLNQFNGNYNAAEMVKAFIVSTEYRSRFGPANATPSPTPTPTATATPSPTPTPTPPGGTSSAVVINKPWIFLTAPGQSAQLTAQLFDAQGKPISGTVTWTSSAPDKISVDASGRLMANAIGSAQIFAESAGVRSAPTLVTLAAPKAGALLVTDAQVVSVGPPLNLAPGESPGVGTQYEVTLKGVTAPAPGIVMLAAETAPVAGKVVATRQDTGGLVVTLALAPLSELFSDYDFKFNIDLSAFPVEALTSQSASATLGDAWNKQRYSSPVARAAAQPNDAVEPFKAFDCDGDIKAQLVSADVGLSLDNQLSLVLDDQPFYSKHALTGSLALVGSASLKLKADFSASGKCNAQALIRLPVFGVFSVFVMPAVRVGLGAELEGEIKIAQGELGAEGKVGVNMVTGWECGGATPDCRSLNNITPINEFKTKSKIPSLNDMQANISAQFYALAGLDAALFGGFRTAGILEARVGPKQSFNLAFEEDQAARTDYASNYDLKVEGVVEPGSALKKAIEEVLTGLQAPIDAGSFKLQLSGPTISESPKGSLSLDKARVRPQETVQFSVVLNQSTLQYFLLGCNVDRVELWRKGENDTDFKYWKTMDQNASAQCPYSFTYAWTPTLADAGKYQFAAFVSTKIPVPLLEVAPNSIQNLEVSCYSAGGARIGTQASICTDTWVGTYSRKADSSEVGLIEQVNSNITWTVDPSQSTGAFIVYKPSGSFDLKIGAQMPGCTAQISPSTFTIDPASGFLAISAGSDTVPGTFNFGTRQGVSYTETVTCPGQNPMTLPVQGSIDYGSGTGPFMDGQLSLSGSNSTQVGSTTITYSYVFKRP